MCKNNTGAPGPSEGHKGRLWVWIIQPPSCHVPLSSLACGTGARLMYRRTRNLNRTVLSVRDASLCWRKKKRLGEEAGGGGGGGGVYCIIEEQCPDLVVGHGLRRVIRQDKRQLTPYGNDWGNIRATLGLPTKWCENQTFNISIIVLWTKILFFCS